MRGSVQSPVHRAFPRCSRAGKGASLSLPFEPGSHRTCVRRSLSFNLDLIKQLRNNTRVIGFAALADPTRRRILEMLAMRELPAGEIARRFDMTPPAVSQHLKLLRAA